MASMKYLRVKHEESSVQERMLVSPVPSDDELTILNKKFVGRNKRYSGY
jgi:hypothetical protein